MQSIPLSADHLVLGLPYAASHELIFKHFLHDAAVQFDGM